MKVGFSLAEADNQKNEVLNAEVKKEVETLLQNVAGSARFHNAMSGSYTSGKYSLADLSSEALETLLGPYYLNTNLPDKPSFSSPTTIPLLTAAKIKDEFFLYLESPELGGKELDTTNRTEPIILEIRSYINQRQRSYETTRNRYEEIASKALEKTKAWFSPALGIPATDAFIKLRVLNKLAKNELIDKAWVEGEK